MSWYRREMVFSGTIALMLVAVLGAASYLISPQTEDFQNQYVDQTPEINAFILMVSNASSESLTLENRTIRYDMTDWFQLECEFTFSGHIYPIHVPSTNGKTMIIGPVNQVYCGEFNATPLQGIDIKMDPMSVFWFDNLTYFEKCRNVTISASLSDTQIQEHHCCCSVSHYVVQITDLGTLTSINDNVGIYNSTSRGNRGNNIVLDFRNLRERELSRTGFWGKDHEGGWFINVDQLSSMLQGNGTAVITFNATINTRIKYELKNENTGTIEVTLPQWEGTLGTIEIVHEQGKITWIRYNFYSASITIIPTS